jgi:hypothetical protein
MATAKQPRTLTAVIDTVVVGRQGTISNHTTGARSAASHASATNTVLVGSAHRSGLAGGVDGLTRVE